GGCRPLRPHARHGLHHARRRSAVGRARDAGERIRTGFGPCRRSALRRGAAGPGTGSAPGQAWPLARTVLCRRGSRERGGQLAAERGRFTVAEGNVLSVRESAGTIYMNFGRRWSQALTVTISKRDERVFAAAGVE